VGRERQTEGSSGGWEEGEGYKEGREGRGRGAPYGLRRVDATRGIVSILQGGMEGHGKPKAYSVMDRNDNL